MGNLGAIANTPASDPGIGPLTGGDHRAIYRRGVDQLAPQQDSGPDTCVGIIAGGHDLAVVHKDVMNSAVAHHTTGHHARGPAGADPGAGKVQIADGSVLLKVLHQTANQVGNAMVLAIVLAGKVADGSAQAAGIDIGGLDIAGAQWVVGVCADFAQGCGVVDFDYLVGDSWWRWAGRDRVA